MTIEHLITVWSIRIAVYCLFGFLTARLLAGDRASNGKRTDIGTQPEPALVILRVLQWIWCVGALFSLAHLLCAMGFVHQWSHLRAVEDTALQTEEVLGIRVGLGVYFNYLFVAVWLTDAAWILQSKRSYFSRKQLWNWLVYGYLAFIAINGAIVFEAGFIRWTTLLLLATLGGVWIRQRRIK